MFDARKSPDIIFTNFNTYRYVKEYVHHFFTKHNQIFGPVSFEWVVQEYRMRFPEENAITFSKKLEQVSYPDVNNPENMAFAILRLAQDDGMTIEKAAYMKALCQLQRIIEQHDYGEFPDYTMRGVFGFVS